MHMERRAFLERTTGIGAALGPGLFDRSEARAEMRELKVSRATETRSTCPGSIADRCLVGLRAGPEVSA